MASAWITKRTTKDGGLRYRVEFRLGGREAQTRYGGSFTTKREANERKGWIRGELAARRIPDLTFTDIASPTFAASASNWQAARVDVAASTRGQHRIQLDKLLPLIGTRRIDTLTAQHFIDVVADLHAQGVARETIRKSLGSSRCARPGVSCLGIA